MHFDVFAFFADAVMPFAMAAFVRPQNSAMRSVVPPGLTRKSKRNQIGNDAAGFFDTFAPHHGFGGFAGFDHTGDDFQ